MSVYSNNWLVFHKAWEIQLIPTSSGFKMAKLDHLWLLAGQS